MVCQAAAKRNVCRLVSPAVSQSVPTMSQLSLSDLRNVTWDLRKDISCPLAHSGRAALNGTRAQAMQTCHIDLNPLPTLTSTLSAK